VYSGTGDEAEINLLVDAKKEIANNINCLLSPHVLTNIIHIAFHSVPAGVSVKANALIF
jgi:hypothetical protein